METTTDTTSPDLQPLVAEIVSGYLTKNQVAPGDIPRLIISVYETLKSLGKPAVAEARTPAVPIRQSVTRDYVVCLECGRRAKTLRRHIAAGHSLNPAEYKARWNLSAGYSLVAPGYSERRSGFAKQIGLGVRMGRNRDKASTVAPSDV